MKVIELFLIQSWIFHNILKCFFSKNFKITPTDKTPGSWLSVVYLLFGYINNYLMCHSMKHFLMYLGNDSY